MQEILLKKQNSVKYNFADLIQIMADLRNPESGCPWDIEQTHLSLLEYLIEEAYEFVEAAELGLAHDMLEELGDVFLQVIFHAQIAQENRNFDIHDVIHTLAKKLVDRHPHVFGEVKLEGATAVETQWEEIKKLEKNKQERKSLMDGVARGLSPLAKARKIQKKAAKVGFDWKNPEDVWDKLNEEVLEFKEAILENDPIEKQKKMNDEMGDLFFTLVNLSRKYNIDPEMALREANRKFESRLREMEKISDQNLESQDSESLEKLWVQAKIRLEL